MKNIQFAVLILLSLLALAACSPLSVKGTILSITLACNPNLPYECIDQQFEESKEIKVFQKAIQKARKMKGALDYEPEFVMTIMFSDGSKRQFHLSLTSNRDFYGLLLELPNTMQGYRIPVSTANQLRDIIYMQD